MQDELKDFRRKVSAAGRLAFEPRVGMHAQSTAAERRGASLNKRQPRDGSSNSI